MRGRLGNDQSIRELGNDGPGGLPRGETFRHVAHAESHVMITNNRPGLSALKLVVNGQTFELRTLQDGQTVELDVSSAMRKGNSTLVVTAQGKEAGSAFILIADS